ncbi:MAG: YebC/PmpR family DNA-binding transcriptional regulator [Phycisphaeraceae bacterium]|nr:YebC/PmpR family DNA-binding transcriptional regulator [Phycisphaeraceae bacterium]
MAGHSKWHNIQHRKAAVDKKRGKIWTKCARAIMSAARQGGPDPTSNLPLRYAIDEARYANMPKDTIQRAIDKATGAAGTDDFENVVYEAYGPGGAAIIVLGLTDNRTRTASDLRLILGKNGGNLGNPGSVSYMFDPRGQIVATGAGLAADQVIEKAIEAGAIDVEEPDDPSEADAPWTILTEVAEFQQVKDALEAAGLKIEAAELAHVPQNHVSLDAEAGEKMMTLVDALEDLDDVQKVFTNAEIGG